MARNIVPLSEVYERLLFLTSQEHANGITEDSRLQWNPSTVVTINSYCYNPNNPMRSRLIFTQSDIHFFQIIVLD